MARSDVIVTEKNLRGLIARYAVQQSPYACPDGLDRVLTLVRERFRNDPKIEKMMGTRID